MSLVMLVLIVVALVPFLIKEPKRIRNAKPSDEPHFRLLSMVSSSILPIACYSIFVRISSGDLLSLMESVAIAIPVMVMGVFLIISNRVLRRLTLTLDTPG